MVAGSDAAHGCLAFSEHRPCAFLGLFDAFGITCCFSPALAGSAKLGYSSMDVVAIILREGEIR